MSELVDKADNRKTKNHSIIEYVKHVIPVAYLVLVFWGLLYVTVYYSFYNINIINYVELSEILLVLYDDFLIAVLCAFVGILVGTGLVKIPIDMLEVLIWKIRKKDINLQPYIFYGVIALGMITLIISTAHDVNKLYVFSAVFAAIAFSGSEQKFEPSIKTVFRAFLLVFITILIANSAHRSARLAVKDSLKVEIVLNNPSPMEANTILIGETRNYLFLYSVKDSATTAISRDQVKHVRYFNRKTVMSNFLRSVPE